MKKDTMNWMWGTAAVIAFCLITSVTWGQPTPVNSPEGYRGSTHVKVLDFDLAQDTDMEE